MNTAYTDVSIERYGEEFEIRANVANTSKEA
jgi:hypothetical protein